MTVQISLANEGIRPDLEVVNQYGTVTAQADFYEAAIEALRASAARYPQANWVIYVVLTRSYNQWTASGVAAFLSPAPATLGG